MTFGQGISLDVDSGVVVRTPQAEARPFINYMNIPWFHFLKSTEPYSRSRVFRDELVIADVGQSNAFVHCLHKEVTASNPRSQKGADLCLGSQANSSRGLAKQLHDALSAWTGVHHVNDLSSVSQNDTQLEVASLQRDVFDNSNNLHGDLHSGLRNNPQDSFNSFCPPPDNFAPTHPSSLGSYEAGSFMTMVESSIRTLPFLADFAGPLTERTLHGFEQRVRNYQEDLAIGVRDLDPKLVKPGSSELLLRMMGFLVYLSSNRVLGTKVDPLVRWLHDSGLELLLWQLLDFKTSTTEIFGSMVFRTAAKLGFTDMVRKFIDKGFNVNSVEGDTFERETALKLAVTANRIEVVRLLLQRGANLKPCKGARYLDSILYRALDGPDRIEMMQTLLENGADVNEYDNEYDNYGDFECLKYKPGSVLRYAISRNDHAMTRMLLKAGAHVNMIHCDWRSPLHHAVEMADVEMVQILIDAGAEVNGTTQMFLAAQLKEKKYEDLLATPIQLAAEVNNPKLVQMLLDEGADPRRPVHQKPCRNDDENTVPTVLQSAVRFGNAVMVDMLLKACADVNDRAGHSDPPLALAAANADLKTVRILLRHGAHINAPAKKFRKSATALQAAVRTGDLEVVKELLVNGADVNADAGPIIGRTALQAAAEEGKFEMVIFLISKGADLNAGPSLEMGVTCLQAAIGQGHVDLALFLLDNGAYVNSPSAAQSGEMTTLQAALEPFNRHTYFQKVDEADEHSRSGLVKALIKAGADLNSPSSPGRSLSTLTIAVLSGQSDLVDLLLENGVDPDQCVSYRSPLGEAVVQGKSKLVRCLINAVSDMDAWYENERYPYGVHNFFGYNHFGGTPLQVAAFEGHVEIAQLLLDAGAEIGVVHHPSPSGTALQYAVMGNNTHMVKFLLEKGANPNTFVRGSLLELGLKDYFRPPNLEIIATLINAGADTNPTRGHHPTRSLFNLPGATKGGPELVDLLLKNGASVNGTYNGMTVLQSVASCDTVGVVEALLKAGAYVNGPAEPYYGRTALQYATERGDLEMVKLLLSRGADVNAPAGHEGGITALQGAMWKGSLKMVLTLLEAGANINDAPAAVNGRTALEAAAEFGRLDIVHLLLNNDTEPDTIEARCKRAADFAEEQCHSIIARDLRQHKPRQ